MRKLVAGAAPNCYVACMALFISTSPKKFIEVVSGRPNKVISRFNPNRSQVETAKPTIAEKKRIHDTGS